MADEHKESWWKSLPGILTAATGFVAALSGLVAGLSSLGVFRREEPPPQVVGEAPAPRESTVADWPRPGPADSDSSAAPAPAPAEPEPPAQGPTAHPAPAPATEPEPAPDSAPEPVPAPAESAAAAADTDTAATGPARLPKGTVLELVVPARTCAPAEGAKRFTARLAAPVRIEGATVLPVNTTAVLRLRRAGSPTTPQVRLDSLARRDVALSVPRSEVRLRRGAAAGACLRANARLTAELGTAVTLR